MTTPPVTPKVKYVSEGTKAFRAKIKKSYPSCHGTNPDPDRKCPSIEEINSWLEKNKVKSKKPPMGLMPKEWECRTCIYMDE